MPPRPIRVCLILHSTRSDNLGVGALTASEVSILRDIGRDLGRAIEITAMDWKDPRVPYVTGPDIRVVDLDGKAMLNPFGYFAIALRSDLVIDIGAGDSFADIYGSSRLAPDLHPEIPDPSCPYSAGHGSADHRSFHETAVAPPGPADDAAFGRCGDPRCSCRRRQRGRWDSKGR